LQGFRFFDPNIFVFQYFVLKLGPVDLLYAYFEKWFCVYDNINMGNQQDHCDQALRIPQIVCERAFWGGEMSAK